MELKLRIRIVYWWFWATTLLFLVTAVAGWAEGRLVVVVISAVQVLYFLGQKGFFLMAFPVQIRLVFFALTVLGLYVSVVQLLLLAGITMVVLH